MDWSYFRKEPDGFSLKRLPAVTKPVRIKDATEVGDYREDFIGVSFDSGVVRYQRLFDSPDCYEIDVEPFDEAADRAPASLLLEMAPFKGHMADVEGLIGSPEPVDLELSEAALEKAIASRLVEGGAATGYRTGPRLAGEFTGLIERMISGVREAIGNMPESYQAAVWHELVIWDGLPRDLARKTVGAHGGPIGRRIADEAQTEVDSYAPGSEYGPPHFDPPLELHFHYQGSRDSYPKQRRVAVHHIVGVHQAYLKGRCLESNEERSFLGHRIDGEILNTQTGELIAVSPDTTSQQLREALRALRTTDKPSGVAPRGKVDPTPTPSPSPLAKKPGTPWHRRPAIWLWVAAILLWWFVLR